MYTYIYCKIGELKCGAGICARCVLCVVVVHVDFRACMIQDVVDDFRNGNTAQINNVTAVNG